MGVTVVGGELVSGWGCVVMVDDGCIEGVSGGSAKEVEG